MITETTLATGAIAQEQLAGTVPADLPVRADGIMRAWDIEQSRPPQPVHAASELPTDYNCITDAWLEAILCRGVDGAKVIGHTLGPVDNGSSNRRKIVVDYNAAGREAGLPTRLFGKAGHDLANRMLLGLAGAAEYETAFFRHIRKHLDIVAPTALFSEYDPVSFNMLTLLIDISDDVLEFCDHHSVIDRARAESAVRLLARFHATGYRNSAMRAEFRHFLTWRDYFGRQLPWGIQAGSEAGFQDGRSVIPPRLFARANEIWPATERSIALHASLPATFTHGDPHLKNWYITNAGDMGLGDWQCCNVAHHSRDLAYTLSTALAPEDRRAWERDLVALYNAELRRQGGPDESFDALFLAYRQQMITALTWWTITLHPAADIPDMQPRDVTLEFVRRIAVAMDDLGTLDALAA